MTIKNKLIFGFLGISIFVAILGAITISLSQDIEEKIEEINKSNFVEIQSSTQLNFHLQRLKSNIREVMLETNKLYSVSKKHHNSKQSDVPQLRSGENHSVGGIIHAIGIINTSLEQIVSLIVTTLPLINLASQSHLNGDQRIDTFAAHCLQVA